MEMLQLTKNKNSEPVIICHLSQELEGNDGLQRFHNHGNPTPTGTY